MQLVEASDAEKRARDRLTASAWGTGLGVEQFLVREAGLRAHRFARASMRTWLWRDASGVGCSCETFEVPARRGFVTGRAFIIASVFTEAARRREGHATALLGALATHLRSPETLALALFSEVGPALYQRCGFVAQPATDVLLDARPAERSEVTWSDAPVAPVFRVEPDALTVATTEAQCDWHLERERLYAAASNRPTLSHHVASLGHSRLAVTRSFQTNELHVLWYEFSTPDEARALLDATAALAHDVGVPTVRIWETTALPALPSARRAPRSDELPMVRPMDGGTPRWADITRGLWA